MSKVFDAAEADEKTGKERVPKGYGCCNRVTWACDEESHDCHRKMGRYQKYIVQYSWIFLRRTVGLPFSFL